MMKNEYKDARISLYILAFLLLFAVVFYFFASMFTSMGYNAFYEVAQKEKKNEKTVVVIDAGHGGEDPGAVAGKVIEKELNLDVSLLLNELFSANGTQTVMTRTSDVLLYNAGEENRKKYYDLHNRLKAAESCGESAIFVSIHMNKFPSEKYWGLQTFYSENNAESSLLAQEIQNSAMLLQPENTRAIKSGMGTIFLLEQLKIPAVLVECGFISNNDEAARLSDELYRKQLALSIYCGICAYAEGNSDEK